MKKCPHCAELIPDEMSYCVFCMKPAEEPTEVSADLPRKPKTAGKIITVSVAAAAAVCGLSLGIFSMDNGGPEPPATETTTEAVTEAATSVTEKPVVTATEATSEATATEAVTTAEITTEAPAGTAAASTAPETTPTETATTPALYNPDLYVYDTPHNDIISPSAYTLPFLTYTDSNGTYYDSVLAYDFVCDDYVLGKWKMYNSISKASYSSSGSVSVVDIAQRYVPVAASAGSFLETQTYTLEFFGNGNVHSYSKYINSDGEPDEYEYDLPWSMGSIERYSRSVESYAVVNIAGADYMIVESKNGDYVTTNEIREFYVYVRAD